MLPKLYFKPDSVKRVPIAHLFDKNFIPLLTDRVLSPGYYCFLEDHRGQLILKPCDQHTSGHKFLAQLTIAGDLSVAQGKSFPVYSETQAAEKTDISDIKSAGELVIGEDGKVIAWSLASGSFPRYERYFTNVNLPETSWYPYSVFYEFKADSIFTKFFDIKGQFVESKSTLSEQIILVKVTLDILYQQDLKQIFWKSQRFECKESPNSFQGGFFKFFWLKDSEYRLIPFFHDVKRVAQLLAGNEPLENEYKDLPIEAHLRQAPKFIFVGEVFIDKYFQMIAWTILHDSFPRHDSSLEATQLPREKYYAAEIFAQFQASDYFKPLSDSGGTFNDEFKRRLTDTDLQGYDSLIRLLHNLKVSLSEKPPGFFLLTAKPPAAGSDLTYSTAPNPG